MTTKKFLNWALIFNVVTSLLSVLFSFIFFEASGILAADDGLLSLISYIKKFFDLLAVFTGYGTIMYAFSRYASGSSIHLPDRQAHCSTRYSCMRPSPKRSSVS